MTMNLLNKNDIEQKIMIIVADKLTSNKEQLSPVASLHELGIDSLDLVEIVLEIEDTFNCLVDDSTIEHLQTIEEIVCYVHDLCKK